MNASEALFLGEPCAHAAEFYERLRLKRIEHDHRRAARRHVSRLCRER